LPKLASVISAACRLCANKEKKHLQLQSKKYPDAAASSSPETAGKLRARRRIPRRSTTRPSEASSTPTICASDLNTPEDKEIHRPLDFRFKTSAGRRTGSIPLRRKRTTFDHRNLLCLLWITVPLIKDASPMCTEPTAPNAKTQKKLLDDLALSTVPKTRPKLFEVVSHLDF
ncbi:hypothetical protein U1Q18_045498, partial [Sarracenia purpurea var. burkii]